MAGRKTIIPLKQKVQLFPYQIYLVKDSVESFKDVIKQNLGKRKSGQWIKGKADLGISWELYFATSKSPKTDWAKIVERQLLIPELDTSTRSHGAVLILKVKGRIFAITFGYGRSLLDLEKIEEDLGIETSQRLIDPEKVIAVETTILSGMLRKESTQTVRPANSSQFEVDTTNSIVRGLTGGLKDEGLGKQLSGSVAATLIADANFKRLPELCSKLLEAYEKDTQGIWKSHFSHVKDPKLIGDLHQKLLESLHEGRIENIWVSPPDNVDFSNITKLKFSNLEDNPEVWDLNIGQFLSALKRPDQITINTLKGHSIQAFIGGSEEPSATWPIIKCLTYECDLNSKKYILHGRKWFSVAKSLAEEVDACIDSIPAGPTLPKAIVGKDEGEYNSRVAREEEMYLLDKKLVPYGGQYSKIEVADLFSNSKELFHIKIYGGSAHLSYLFHQGRVSMEALLRDQGVREKARAKLESALCPRANALKLIPDDFEATKYAVIFGIIGARSGAWAEVLPFIAKLSLRNEFVWFRERGIRVALTRIDVEEEKTASSNRSDVA